MKMVGRVLLAFVIPLAVSSAQTSFSSTDVQSIFGIGKVWHQYWVGNDTGGSVGTYNIGSPSASNAQVWSLPGFALVDTTLMYLVSPASTPFPADFPGATVVQQSSFPTATSFEYYRFTPDSMVNLGTADTMQGVSPILRTKNRVELLFPATLGSTFASRDYQPGGGGWWSIQMRTNTWDAYGTLSFPLASYQTMRLKTRKIQYQYNNLGVLQSQDTSYSFLWPTKEGYIFEVNEGGTQQVDSGTVNVLAFQYTVVTMATGVQKVRETLPAEFRLSQNYPNPFNPSTRISYSLPSGGFTVLTVHNILGERVATLFDGVQAAGEHSVTFSGSNLSSGVYFYRLQHNGQILTRRMVLLK